MNALSWIEFDKAYYNKSIEYEYEGNMESIWRRRIQIHKRQRIDKYDDKI